MSMTEREKVKTALAGKQPEGLVPVWELEFHLYNAYSSKPITIGRQFAALTAAEKEYALAQNAEIMVAVAKNLGHSAITSIDGYWEVAPGHEAYLWLPDDYPWKQLAALRKAAGSDLAVIKFVGSLIGSPGAADFEDFCYRLYDAPEQIDEAAQKRLPAGIEETRRARDLGADAVCDTCDIADNHGVFFKPDQLDRFWYPYLHRWTAAVKDMGLYSILHSDGNLTAIIPELAASGLGGLQAIDPVAGMDIVAVKKQTKNNLCLCGNIDLGLLQFGPVEKITAQTRTVCEQIKPGGAFILGASNAVFQGIPPAHYDAMLAAWRQYGSY
jgi:uroporphyrinogen decarboxylase